MMEFFTMFGYAISCVLVLLFLYGGLYLISYSTNNDEEESALISALGLILFVSMYITIVWANHNGILSSVSDNNIEMEVGEDEGNASVDHIFDNNYCYDYCSNN